jgi:hypothetical protein
MRIDALFRRWDQFVDRRIPGSWGRYTPRKRALYASVIILECTVALLVFGFVVGDTAAWVISGLVWIGTVVFFVAVARHPAPAFRVVPRVLLGLFLLFLAGWAVAVLVLVLTSV